MNWRLRVALAIGIVIAYQWLSVPTGSTLAALVFDGSKWSIPPDIDRAVSELREEGREVRMVDWDVTNGNDGSVVELADCIAAGKRLGGDHALTFRTGGRVSAGPTPLDKQAFKQAMK